MDIPESMKSELGAWNNGEGIDLETWIGCEGSFALAIGYLTLFWPKFVEFEGYILRSGFSVESLRSFERHSESTRSSVEWVMNHIHLVDLHYVDKEVSRDKIVLLGNKLKEMYEAKLKWQFPERQCVVEFYIPQDIEALDEYQLSFWQE